MPYSSALKQVSGLVIAANEIEVPRLGPAVVVGGDSHESESFFDRRGSGKPELRSTLRQPLDSLEREEFWRMLRACLDALPVRLADVFVLREIEGHSTKEICKELEITPTSAWVVLHRARRRLAIDMNSHWRQEGPD